MIPYGLLPSIGFTEASFTLSSIPAGQEGSHAGYEIFYVGNAHPFAEVLVPELPVDTWFIVTNERPVPLFVRPIPPNRWEHGVEAVVLNLGDTATIQAIDVDPEMME